MKKREQPIDINKIRQKWIWDFGRLRFGYVNYSDWKLIGCKKRTWFFVTQILKRYDMMTDTIRHKAFQMTILGFQMGYMFYGTPKPIKK